MVLFVQPTTLAFLQRRVFQTRTWRTVPPTITRVHQRPHVRAHRGCHGDARRGKAGKGTTAARRCGGD